MQFTVHSSHLTYVTVGHYVCIAICEMECELGGNSGLKPIVIVIVIMFHNMPLFLLKSGTLMLGFSGII